MKLTRQQDEILQKIYEEPLLVKLGFSSKFPRDVMYMPTHALGLGFLKPSTIVAQLQLKLLVGYARTRSPTHENISVLHEML